MINVIPPSLLLIGVELYRNSIEVGRQDAIGAGASWWGHQASSVPALALLVSFRVASVSH